MLLAGTFADTAQPPPVTLDATKSQAGFYAVALRNHRRAAVSSRKPFIFAIMLALGCGSFGAVAAASGSSDVDVIHLKGMSQTFVTCQTTAGDNAVASDACMSSEVKVQDARLNKTYKALLGALKPEAKAALVEAERSWVQSTSKDQAFESKLYGDSQAENAQQLENKLVRLCARANALDSYLALAQL